jgi:surface protein
MISGIYNDELEALCHMTIKLCGDDCNLNWIDTSEIRNMKSLFQRISRKFNGDVTRWNVSNVRDMSFMFCGCDYFNRNISKWKTGKVSNMQYMFSAAGSFNCNVSGWDVHNVTNMQVMFRDSAIDCDLSKWKVGKVKNHRDMFVRTKLEFDYDRQPKFKI